MKEIGRTFKEVFKQKLQRSRQGDSTLKSKRCLLLFRLYIVLSLGILIAKTFPTSSAVRVIKVLEGETALLDCTNKTLSGQVSYQWSPKDGTFIPKHIPKNTSVLVLPATNKNSSGTYHCQYTTNGSSLFNESLQLIVQYPPSVIKVLSSRNPIIKPGGNIVISCIIDAVPPVKDITWTKDKEIYNVSTNISISNAKCSDQGEYECFPSNGIGTPSKNGSIKLIVKEPSEPVGVTATARTRCPITRTVYVNWSRPLQVNGRIEDLRYQVYYRNSENKLSSWLSTNTTQWTNYTIMNLNHSTTYYMKVQACIKGTSCCSKYSNLTIVSLKNQDCAANNKDKEGGLSRETIIALAIIATIILIIFFIVLVVLIIKRRNWNNHTCCTMPFKGLFNIEAPTSLSRVSSYKERRDREAIPYERFWNHVILRHADSNYRFSSEFESLQGIIEKNKKLTWIHSQRPENQSKNRFANVVAYDQTRVVLSMIDNAQGSHYINANYVDSNNAMNFYIATQGPLANTISDFWRMVWEQNSRVIVMITNIIEKGRHKCAQYWPTKNKKVQDHGQLRVTFLREEHFAFYTQREFEVKPLKESIHYTQDTTDEAIKPMIVQQYHFTGWPDHGVPDPGYEIPVLDFIFKSTAAQVEGAGPLIVHCSAGVGRSGAYIVIDSMVKRIHENGDIDIFNFLCQIRQQRNHLVQEECQYIFVHDVILEYIQCGFLLSLPKKALNEHLHKLRTIMQSSGKNKLTAEFERLKGIKIQDYSVKDGQKTCNISKNRNTNVIPVDSCRVKLYPKPGKEGSDYINASYIDGFWRREAYIATQYPVESTIFDFWRMIWQENCRTIVMLISKDELNKTDIYPKYLPVVHDTARFGVYEVTMESETVRGDLMIRDLRMISLNEPGETRRIRHFHFLHWPSDSQPWSGQCLLQLVSKVDDWEKDVKSKSKPFDMIGPIVVHCSTGAGRTAVYCMLHTLWHQVVREEVVSVYPFSRLYFHQRLNFLQTQAQYEFIYDTMVEFIDADCSLYLV